MKIAALLLSATLIGAPLAAIAAFIDGNELYDACVGSEKINGQRQFCVGYTIGVFDATDSGLCVPREVTLTQVHDVIVKYLAEHPEERHQPAALLANSAVREAFPC